MKTFLAQSMACLVALSTAVCARAQIESVPIEIDTDAGVARGWVAVVDLTDPAVRIETLVRMTEDAGVAELVSPEAWLADEELKLVVNANFFGARPEGVASIVGVCVADGVVVSPPRAFGGAFDPALIVTDEGRVVIGHIGDDALSAARSAVAGVGGSENSDIAGTLLVEAGEALGATARVQPMARHPRTAAGVTRDGDRLIVMVIDGRQDGWSVGVTLPELAEAMIERGAWDALNLDGGGSSAMLLREGDQIATNRPSDGGFRPVAVSLGVRVAESASASQADEE